MKTLNVVAAIIKKDNQVLATKRGYGEFINMWEFPGGKIEPDETKEEALIRCFEATITEGTPKLLEHNDARWLTKDELNDVNWIPADLTIIDYLKETMGD